MNLLSMFEAKLELSNMENMEQQLNLLNIQICAANTQTRTVQIKRPSKDASLGFNVFCDYEKNEGIYIDSVTQDSNADLQGLKSGDQILNINGQAYPKVLMKTFNVHKLSYL